MSRASPGCAAGTKSQTICAEFPEATNQPISNTVFPVERTGITMTNTIIIIVGLSLLAIIVLAGLLARMFRKAGPNEALVVYGFRGPRVIKGHGTVIFPMVESCRELSLELMSFDVAPQQDLYTKQGVAVTVEAVAQIKVRSDQESILRAAGAVPDQSPAAEGGADPAGDGRSSPRHYRAADGGADRQGAGNGRRPHACDVR